MGYILDDSKLYSADTDEGTRQKLLSVFFMLRGGGIPPPILLRVFGHIDFRLRGGWVPPIPLSFFGHNDFPSMGEGVPPVPLRKKSTKNRYFWPKKANFSPC